MVAMQQAQRGRGKPHRRARPPPPPPRRRVRQEGSAPLARTTGPESLGRSRAGRARPRPHRPARGTREGGKQRPPSLLTQARPWERRGCESPPREVEGISRQHLSPAVPSGSTLRPRNAASRGGRWGGLKRRDSPRGTRRTRGRVCSSCPAPPQRPRWPRARRWRRRSSSATSPASRRSPRAAHIRGSPFVARAAPAQAGGPGGPPLAPPGGRGAGSACGPMARRRRPPQLRSSP